MLKDEVVQEGGRPRAKRRGSIMRQRRFLIGGLVVLLALAYLMFTAFQGAAMYYVSVSELKAMGPEAYGQALRLNGKVAPGSAQWDGQQRIMRFDVADDGETIPVVYRGVVPDTFNDDIEVVAEGHYTEAGIFEANKLLVKCPSKYEPAS